MWSYAFNVYFCVDYKPLVYIGFVSAIGHMLSPIIFKFSRSLDLATNNLIGMGFFFQFTYAYLTGGFFSSTIIWFSILPLLAAIISGKKSLIFWSIVASIAAIIQFMHEGENVSVSPMGEIWAQLNITVGYTVLNLVLMFVFLSFESSTKKKMFAKNESIKKLLRVLGHDIANPLTVAMTAQQLSQSALKNNDTEKVIHFGQKIEKSLTMVAEILDSTRRLEEINTAKLKFSIENIFLNTIIENSLFVFNEKISSKKINVHYDFEKNHLLSIKADPISIKNEVFNNLFSNAIKFIPPGGDIIIKVIKKSNRIYVSFKDNGIGMDEFTLNNLFRSNIKTTQLGIQGEKGTGFGMPILHSCLNDIGATIEVKSITHQDDPSNQGTEFMMGFLS